MCRECREESSTESLPFPVFATSKSEEQGFITKLKVFRVRNINRIIIADININLIRNKIHLLKLSVFLWFQRVRLMTFSLQVNL